jgi:hypothetical protein
MPGLFTGPIKSVRNREYTTASDGSKWKRRIMRDGQRTDWEPASPEPEQTLEEPPLSLMLVLEKQADGEPMHWYLFLATEEAKGNLYQVKGDATYMTYQFETDVALLSTSYHTSYVVAHLNKDQESIVKQCAETELAPKAHNRAAVVENCQGWTVRVLDSLVREGIADQKWVEFAKSIQEPV